MRFIDQSLTILIVGIKEVNKAGIDPQGDAPVFIILQHILGPVFGEERAEFLVLC